MITCEIQNLNIYPLKSAHGIPLSEAKLTTTGFEWDRNWLVVGADLKLISQRDKDCEKMALIRTEFDFDRDRLVISATGMADLHIPLNPSTWGARITANVHGMTCHGFDEGANAAAWFSSYLERKATLVRVDLTRPRAADSFFTGNDDSTYAGQDDFPLLVTSSESLEALNAQLVECGGKAVPMSRFRTNIQIIGLGPYGEDHHTDLEIAARDIHLRMVKLCGRCRVINIDQESAEVDLDKTPLKALNFSRNLENQRKERKLMFGQNAVIESGIGAKLRVGDLFEVYSS